MNQSDFISAIRGFTKFTDPDVQTDALLISYLRFGEEYLSANLRIADMVQIDTATLTSNRTRMPSDFREMDFLRILGGKPINRRTLDYFYANESEMTTRDFAISGNFLIVGGTISEAAPLSVELHYFGDVEQLTGETESWVARRYPLLLTSATMDFASAGMVETDKSDWWEGKTDSLIRKMNEEYQVGKSKGSKLTPVRRVM